MGKAMSAANTTILVRSAITQQRWMGGIGASAARLRGDIAADGNTLTGLWQRCGADHMVRMRHFVRGEAAAGFQDARGGSAEGAVMISLGGLHAQLLRPFCFRDERDPRRIFVKLTLDRIRSAFS